MNGPFEGVNWGEIRAELDAENSTVERIEKGNQVTFHGPWPYLDRKPQCGTVTRIYARRSRFGGITQMVRVRWWDGSYSAVETSRLQNALETSR